MGWDTMGWKEKGWDEIEWEGTVRREGMGWEGIG